MRQFDELLRRGLMDANLADYEEELERTENWRPDFSPQYRRERIRLAAAPWGWEKRQTRPAWKRAAVKTACALLACTVAFGALMAASPTVRAAVNTWLRQITQDEDHVKMSFYSGEPDKTAAQSAWRLTWLPEEWVLYDLKQTDTDGSWTFFKAAADRLDNEYLDFSWYSSSLDFLSHDIHDKNHKLQTQTTVHGRPADYYEGDSQASLIWEEEDGTLLFLNTYHVIDRSLLEQIAESAAPWTGAPAEYEPGWVPEGHTEYRFAASPGAGSLEWIESSVVLTFQYATDPIRPFLVPSRPPEEVTVNGLPGLCWPALIPVEDKNAGVDDDFSVVTYDLEDYAVLTWEDPETNTSFYIRGIVETEDMLRVAESVTVKR